MWQWLLLILVSIVFIKFSKIYFFWSSKGITYENYFHYLYRVLVQFNTRPVNDVVKENVEKYGRVYGSYRGVKPSLVVADVELAKDVMVKQFGNFFKRSFEFHTGDPLWDNTLTHLPYDQWKSVRTVMGYTFTSAKMRSMIPKLDKVAKRVIEKLDIIAASEDNELLLTPYLKGYGMDSIVAISFGIDLNCIDNPDNQFVKHASDLFKPGLSMVLMMFAPTLMKYIPFINFPPKETSKFFGELGKHILDEKRAKLDETIKNNTADIIDLHLIAQRDDPKSGLTDEILTSQAFLFFIGGLDTTVLTLEFTIYYLAINPEIQETVYQELKKVMGDREEFSYDDMHKMRLLEACSLEALRLVPLAFFVDRVCTKETVVAGISIHEGMVVEFPTAYIHSDPTNFPEPEKFKPERFLKSDVDSDISAFLTFGDGPKNCVGKRLALMNISILLANMMRKMKFEKTTRTPVPLRIRSGIRINDVSKDPLYIRLTPR